MNSDNHPTSLPATPAPRWWLAGLILVIGAVVVVVFQMDAERAFQARNLRSAGAVLATLAALLLWLLLFSRLPWRRRFRIVGGVLGLAVLGAIVFRFQGFSGDLVPQFTWRWNRPTKPVTQAPGLPVSAVAAPVQQETPRSFPQFLGPTRDAMLPELRLATNWVSRPPVLLWRQPVGGAWSGFAVQGDWAITQEQVGEDECVTAFHSVTGERRWQRRDVARYQNPLAGEGPRATPTIVGDRVVTFGATGWLNCLELTTGKLVWQRQVKDEFSAGLPEWGFTSAPLVGDGRVVVSVGGRKDRSLVAYALGDGTFLWGGGKASPGYSAAVFARFAGEEQVVIFNDEHVSSHSPTNGAVLWTYPWKKNHPHVAVPIRLENDRLLISSGYGTGSGLIQVQRTNDTWKAHELWKSTRFRSKFSNPVARDGFAYGLDDGMLACLDLATGELAWKEGRYGHGQVLLVGGRLLVTAEDGRVLLFEISPKQATLLTLFQPLQGKCWNPPALAGDLLFVRNETEAACYRIPLE
jgi:outer membrane protein assembly factor BamB